MGHALVAVDEDGLGLDDDVLLGDQPLVLKVLQRVLGLVELLLQRVADSHQLVAFAHQTNGMRTSRWLESFLNLYNLLGFPPPCPF